MLYVINGKYYILVSGYYKEVNITKARNGEGYDVAVVKDANKNKIESNIVKNYTTISIEEAYRRNNSNPKEI